MRESEQLERAIASIEIQRAALGDVAVDAAITGLRQQMAALDQDKHEDSPALEGERKLVTVMFADISGFTALAEKMDPEAVREIMNACFDRMVPIIENYKGTVDKFLGDAIMALFGAPVTHENDPEYALRAALKMMENLAAFNAERHLDLGLHFGINTGLVIAGGMGGGARQEYSVMGDAVNMASRFEDLSERGEILVGPDTFKRTSKLFVFKALESVKVKGKVDPVTVYRLLGPKTGSANSRWSEIQRISSPLVGRNVEISAIKACMERLLKAQGGILSVIGEAGVGKSRLMAEIREDVSSGRIYWLEAHTLSFGQTISYWPFREILWWHVGITRNDSELGAWRKLENRVAESFPDNVAEILPYLAKLLTLDVPEQYADRVKYLEGESLGHQIFLAARRFFEQLARERPLVLLFEDLHWVDQSSAALLEHLMPLTKSVPMLICVVSRPDLGTPYAHCRAVAMEVCADCYTEIRIGPLTQAAGTQLMHSLLRGGALSPQMQAAILRKAEGNPFFVEEVIRSLVDLGAVVQDSTTGRWREAAQVEQLPIPDTIQAVIMARVDRLDEDVKKVLRMAAVIGRTFLDRVLRAIAGADQQLDRHLTDLQAFELIREKQRMPELEYIFKHALAQEATYESILLQKRRELHAHVGLAIERLFTDRLEEFYSLLAYHYARAESWDKAQEYLFKVGDQAGKIAADTEALAHYEQAMAAYAHAFGDRWDPLQRASLERKIGEALFRRGENEQSLHHLQLALTYLGKPLPTSNSQIRLAIVCEISQQIGHRLLPQLFRKPRGGPTSSVLEEEIRLYELLAWIEAFKSNERLMLIVLRLLNRAEQSRFTLGVAKGSMGMGVVSDLVSLHRLAGGYHRRAVAIAEEMRHPTLMGLANNGLSIHKLCLGAWDTAIEHGQRAAQLCREIGDLHGWGYVTYMVTVAMAYKGDWAEAVVQCREISRLGQDGADPQARCWGLSWQGHIKRLQGQFDEAIIALREASKLAESTQDYRFSVFTGGELGRCYLQQNQLRQALTALEASRQFQIEHNDISTLWLPYFSGLAEVYLLAAEQADESEQTTWRKKAGNACRDALRQGKACRGVMPEAMRLRGTYEWLMGRPTAASKWWRRSLSQAESLAQPYDIGMVFLEMGRRMGNSTHLNHGKSILAEIGACVGEGSR